MTLLLIDALVLFLLVAGIAGLASLTRDDTFAGHTQPSKRVAPDPPRLPLTVAHRR